MTTGAADGTRSPAGSRGAAPWSGVQRAEALWRGRGARSPTPLLRTGLATPDGRASALPRQAHALGFWFQLDDDQRRQHGSPMGPAQPQALNRYSYVLNNPMRWTDPGGHFGVTVLSNGQLTFHLTHDEATFLWDFVTHWIWTALGTIRATLSSLAGMTAKAALDTIVKILSSFGEGGRVFGVIVSIIGTALLTIAGSAVDLVLKIVAFIGLVGGTLWLADWLMGQQGIDLTTTGNLMGLLWASRPTIERQHGVWEGDRLICNEVSVECVMRAITRTSPKG